MRVISKDIVMQLVNMSKGYFLTTIINQALPFLLLPILTRFLTTAEYGTLSLYSFYHLIAFVLVGSPVITMISKHFYESTKGQIASLIGNSICFSFLGAILWSVIVFIAYPILDDYLAVPLIWMMLIPFGAFANVVFTIGLTVCRLQSKVFHFSLHQIGNTVINFAISIILVCLFCWGWMGRAVGFMLSYFISAILVIVYLKREDYLIWEFDKVIQSKVLSFVMSLVPNTLQMIIISQVGLFFMQLYFTKELCGLYSLGFQIAFCVKLGIDTLMMSWEPHLFEQLALEDKMDKLKTTKLLWGLVGLLILGCLVTLLLCKPVLWLMSTPPFYAASQFVPWFIFGLFFYGIYRFISPVIIKFDERLYLVKASFISMVVMLIMNICLPRYCGYMGITYAYCISYFVLCVLLIVKVQCLLHLPLLKIFENGSR